MQASEIISVIVNKLGFKQDTKDRNSFYKECPIGGDKLLVVRISNHRTYLQTWADRYKPTQTPNNKTLRRMGNNLPAIFRKKYFYSFVFEDENDSIGNTIVNEKRKITVIETVNKTMNFNQQMLQSYIQALQQLMSSLYYDTDILGKSERVITQGIQESMRITESELRQYIQEAIREVLSTLDQ